MNVPSLKNETASAKRETKPSSDVVGFEQSERHARAVSSSSAAEDSHHELKSPDQTYYPAEKPSPGTKMIAFGAAASATDHNGLRVADKGTPTCKRRRLLNKAASVVTELPDIPLRELIPPKDCLQMQRRPQTGSRPPVPAPQGAARVRCNWSAVIARARSHPHEASAPYFGVSAASAAAPSSATVDGILAYKPLHAMLKHDPPLDAVEAVLRAHPEAALDVTFEGSALKIAAEGGVGSMRVLRLLLVAEMAMRKRFLLMQQQQRQRRKQQNSAPSNLEGRSKENEAEAQQRHGAIATARDPGSSQSLADLLAPESGMFRGHNPIRWIAERRIPAKTAAMLLKWYPAGAFQRPFDGDGIPADDAVLEIPGLMLHDGMNKLQSPLIEIVDDFSRDHYDQAVEGGNDGGYGPAAVYDGTYYYDHDSEMHSDDNAHATPWQRERLQKERRWEKFLHILYCTDLALQSRRRHPLPVKETSPAIPAAATAEDPTTAGTTSPVLPLKSSVPGRPSPTTTTTAPGSTSPDETPFRPVHAWIRCLTSPRLGLERCRPYGAWSILSVMAWRIPSEFAARDAADGDRTAFQTLAESPAGDCRLRPDEVRDVVECLINADYRSAFLPRRIDGRLIGHVAVENGWPCKDLFARRPSATCA